MKKIRFAIRYIKYLFKSVNERGVDSLFVKKILSNAIYVDAEFYAFKNIENIRERLLKTNETITYTDYGAGGNAEQKSTKKIKTLAKSSAKSAKYGQLLFRLVNHFQPTQILELGTSLGISTSYLASVNSSSHVTTIEGSKELSQLASKNFKYLKLKNIKQVVGDFDDKLEEVVSKLEVLDFVFFDGNHRKKPTLSYFETCLQKATEKSVFIFDDIYWSDEMMEAWEEIKKNPKVTITIDLFSIGLVFFKEGQAKQHFLIRY